MAELSVGVVLWLLMTRMSSQLKEDVVMESESRKRLLFLDMDGGITSRAAGFTGSGCRKSLTISHNHVHFSRPQSALFSRQVESSINNH